MYRMRSIGLLLVSAAILQASMSGPKTPRTEPAEDPMEACITKLSGFPGQLSNVEVPPYPANLDQVRLEYFESGCLGNCPVFTLTITKDAATFEGRSHVRAKGKRRAKITQQRFEDFLHAWYNARFFAMRDDYCSIQCPNGLTSVVLDTRESTITLKGPAYEKSVYQCFEAIGNKPLIPRPPDQYFEFTKMLRDFAKQKKWLG